MCNTRGLNCFNDLNVPMDKCFNQCKGLYVDVFKKSSFESNDLMKNMGKIIEKYDAYKRGFQKDIQRIYGSYKITGKFLTKI